MVVNGGLRERAKRQLAAAGRQQRTWRGGPEERGDPAARCDVVPMQGNYSGARDPCAGLVRGKGHAQPLYLPFFFRFTIRTACLALIRFTPMWPS
jgi:hypothetical protein